MEENIREGLDKQWNKILRRGKKKYNQNATARSVPIGSHIGDKNISGIGTGSVVEGASLHPSLGTDRYGVGSAGGWVNVGTGERLNYLPASRLGRRELIGGLKGELGELARQDAYLKNRGLLGSRSALKGEMGKIRGFLESLDSKKVGNYGDGLAGLKFIESEIEEEIGAGITKRTSPGSVTKNIMEQIKAKTAEERYKYFNPAAAGPLKNIWRQKLSRMSEMQRKEVFARFTGRYVIPGKNYSAAAVNIQAAESIASDIAQENLRYVNALDVASVTGKEASVENMATLLSNEQVRSGGFKGKGSLDKLKLRPGQYEFVRHYKHPDYVGSVFRLSHLTEKEIRFLSKVHPEVGGTAFGEMSFNEWVGHQPGQTYSLSAADRKIVTELEKLPPKERFRVARKIETKLGRGNWSQYLSEKRELGLAGGEIEAPYTGARDAYEKSRSATTPRGYLTNAEKLAAKRTQFTTAIGNIKNRKEVLGEEVDELSVKETNRITGKQKRLRRNAKKYVEKKEMERIGLVGKTSRDAQLEELIAEQRTELDAEAKSAAAVDTRVQKKKLVRPDIEVAEKASTETDRALTDINESTKKKVTKRPKKKKAYIEIPRKNEAALSPGVATPKGRVPLEIVTEKFSKEGYGPEAHYLHVGGKRIGAIPDKPVVDLGTEKVLYKKGKLIDTISAAKKSGKSVGGWVSWAGQPSDKEWGAKIKLGIEDDAGKMRMLKGEIPVSGVKSGKYNSREIIEAAQAEADATVPKTRKAKVPKVGKKPRIVEPTSHAPDIIEPTSGDIAAYERVRTAENAKKVIKRKRKTSSEMASKWFKDPRKLKKAGLIAGGAMVGLWMLSRNASTEPTAGESTDDTANRSLYGGGKAAMPEGYRQAAGDRGLLPTVSGPRVQDPQSYRMRVNVKAGSTSDMNYDVFGDQLGRTIANNIGVGDARVNMRVSDNSRSMSDFNIKRKLEQVI